MKKGHIVVESTNALLINGLSHFIDDDKLHGYDSLKDLAKITHRMIQEGKLDLDSPFESIIFTRIVLIVFKIAFYRAIPNEAERECYALWWEMFGVQFCSTDIYEYRRDVNGVLTREKFKFSDVVYQEKYAQRIKIDR